MTCFIYHTIIITHPQICKRQIKIMLIMQYIYIYIYIYIKAFSYYKIYTIYIYMCVYLILLISKDALNLSTATVKPFITDYF